MRSVTLPQLVFMPLVSRAHTQMVVMCSCRELRDIILVHGVGILVAGDVFVPGVTRDRSGTQPPGAP